MSGEKILVIDDSREMRDLMVNYILRPNGYNTLMAENGLAADDVVSVFFTATKDIASVAPALAARQLGFHDVALICAQEMWVEGSLPRVVRLLAHVETDRPRADIVNVYLHGTQVLRADVPAIPDGDAS